MRTLGIGEVARLVGVRPHVIRYWEAELPLLAPRKGRTGRREYTQREVQLLLRLRRLLYERRYTLEGARRELWDDLTPERQDLRGRLDAVRAELAEALMTIQDRPGAEPPQPAAEQEPRPPEADAEEAPVCAPVPAAAEAGEAVQESRMGEKEIRRVFESLGQGHLFEHWEARPAPMRRRLLDDLARLDPALLNRLLARLREQSQASPPLEPVEHASRQEIAADRQAHAIGAECIRRGATAALTVAGGQGTRLGFDGPKGMFPVTPIRGLTLFALIGGKLAAARRRWGGPIPWLVMTSPHNDRETRSYFERERFFGLGADSVHFFVQGSLPVMSPEGELLLAPDGGLAFGPNGHGGVVEGLRSSGLLAALGGQGVEEISYFQVDNPLVTVPDPAFLGFHRRARADVSSKVVEKARPDEKLGSIGRVAGRPTVVEYSDMDHAAMHARDGAGRLVYRQGSIAIHAFRVGFLAGSDLRLPLHLARKRVRVLKPTPAGADVEEREAIKFEMFVFDTIPAAARSMFFEVDRVEEFAPLKNREGADSIETCRRGQVEKAARWLEWCGVSVPRNAEGRSRYLLEVSPGFALDREELAARRASLPDAVARDTLLA